MNETSTVTPNEAPTTAALMDILGEGVTAAEEALAAAKAGRAGEARDLLKIADEQLEAGQGGSAAHAQRRRKLLRLMNEAQGQLPAEETPASAPEADVPAAPAQVADAAPTEPVEAPVPAEEPAAAPEADAAAEKAKRASAPGAHRPGQPTEGQWAKVAEALLLEETNPDWREADAERHWAAMDRAEIEHPKTRFWMRVEEAQALHAELEVAVLRGDFAAANERWERIFDVDTNIRSKAQGERRKGLEGAGEKLAAYEAARARTARIKGWLKAGKRAAAAA